MGIHSTSIHVFCLLDSWNAVALFVEWSKKLCQNLGRFVVASYCESGGHIVVVRNQI